MLPRYRHLLIELNIICSQPLVHYIERVLPLINKNKYAHCPAAVYLEQFWGSSNKALTSNNNNVYKVKTSDSPTCQT